LHFWVVLALRQHEDSVQQLMPQLEQKRPGPIRLTIISGNNELGPIRFITDWQLFQAMKTWGPFDLFQIDCNLGQ
jgi:hypothetical protein